MKRKKLIAAASLVLCLGATAADCKGTGEAKVSGTVIKHTFDGNEKDGIRFLVVVRTSSGDKVARVTAAQWSRCVVTTWYPACKTPRKVT
jgi:hypothetical protein